MLLILSFIAVVFGAGNVVGGFVVTDRMLQMFNGSLSAAGVSNPMGLNVPPLILEIAYLITAVTFIASLKRLSHPRTARSGNQIAMVGMAIAVIATLSIAV